MKQSFRDYLAGLGLSSQAHQKRLFDLYHVVSRLLPGEIDDVFLSQSDDGKPAAESNSLWFFSGGFSLEAKQFLAKDDFEIHRLRHLRNLRIISENFDLQSLAPKPHGGQAALLVEFYLHEGGHCRLRAYGDNCGKLLLTTLEKLQPCL